MSPTIPADKTFTLVSGLFMKFRMQCIWRLSKALRPGIPYMDVYDLSARVMVEGMKELGLMKGNAEDAVHAKAHMPCSILMDWGI